MTLFLNLSTAAEQILRDHYGDKLDRAAVEAIAADGYRTGKLSRYQVQSLLGHDNRWDTELWLADHGLTIQYDINDLEDDRRTLSRLD